MRDDFSEKTKRVLAQRVGFRCSNPTCRRLTVGPTESIERALNIGVAAHITGASPGGPRYDGSLDPGARSGAANAIWLCQNCAKLIDSDPERFATAVLQEWRRESEGLARLQAEHPSQVAPGKPRLAVYCHWQPNPDRRMSGFLVQLENLPSSPATARNVRASLSLHPSLPILGIAKPQTGSGWYEDLHHMVESLIPGELHPGELRPLARLLRLPGALDDAPSAMTIEIRITANDCTPISGSLSIPVWTVEAPFSDEFADRSMILTNALLRTDELREGATPRQVTPIAIASRGAPEALEQTCAEFRLLLERGPDEVDVQRFLRRNPILFHRFAPSRILSEAPILTKYRTDFVIVSENKELHLVEIEAPSMRLLTCSGQPTAGYTHAFQQVLDWLHEFEEEFSACLRGLNLLPSDVVSVLGVVIAGRDVQHSVDELKRLKWVRHNRVAFYTYDDVLRSAEVLKRSLAEHEPPA